MTGKDADANYIRRSLLVYPSIEKMWIMTRSISTDAFIFLRLSTCTLELSSYQGSRPRTMIVFVNGDGFAGDCICPHYFLVFKFLPLMFVEDVCLLT